MEHNVFISHSSKDEQISEQIYSALKERGVSCWMDKFDIAPGIPYARAIANAIEQCMAMVIIVSKNSMLSDDVLNEIEMAHGKKKILIPILVDNATLTGEFEYYLKRRQWILYKGNVDKCVVEICNAVGVIPNASLSVEQPEGKKASNHKIGIANKMLNLFTECRDIVNQEMAKSQEETHSITNEVSEVPNEEDKKNVVPSLIGISKTLFPISTSIFSVMKEYNNKTKEKLNL